MRFAFCMAAALSLASGAASGANDTAALVQIELERRMFSVNTIDGAWGAKSKAALSAWLAANNLPPQKSLEDALKLLRKDSEKHARMARAAARALEQYSARRARSKTPGGASLVEENVKRRVGGAGESAKPPAPYRLCKVTREEVASLVKIPSTPAEKAALSSMGYETILEMYAERGHVSQAMLRRLNPAADWPNPPVGTAIRIPNVETQGELPRAALVKVNLSRFEIRAYAADGALVALFPCSIAADKAKLPEAGELRVKGIAPAPNYTYTSERADESGRHRKFIYPAGPNNPVGSSWIGLSLPSYGIHGTPNPETIGRAESHGCFRLANWNAVRLRRMLDEGCKVVIE